jgi:DNA (cytosine-5)-methyltransferase 1
MVLKLGELFCGPGGIACGVNKANDDMAKQSIKIEHVWATDYHAETCKTYQTNIFPKSPEKVLCDDIRTMDFVALRNISPIDFLSFGFPCNDFSIVGEQKGIHGVYGPLYTYAVKALAEFKPKYFLAENVGGLQHANEGKAFSTILSEFENTGYKLYPHLYKFEDYGIPQSRHRIIIIGIRKDLDVEFKVPKPLFKIKTAKEALSSIPEWAANNELTRQSQKVIERLKYIKPGENAFTATLPADLVLNVKGAKISQIYKRLDPDKPAYTVTGSGGGGTHIYHWKEPRALTNRERARLQTFPDDFVFYGSKESVRRQIGMAVPPEGVRVILVALMKSILGIRYESILCNIEVPE